MHKILTSAIQSLQQSRDAARVLFFVRIAGGIWLAPRYIPAFMRASTAIYDIEEGRPIWMTLPVRVGVTIALLALPALLALGAFAVVVTGDWPRRSESC